MRFQCVSVDFIRIQRSSMWSQEAFLGYSRDSQEVSDLRGYQGVSRGVLVGLKRFQEISKFRFRGVLQSVSESFKRFPEMFQGSSRKFDRAVP